MDSLFSLVTKMNQYFEIDTNDKSLKTYNDNAELRYTLLTEEYKEYTDAYYQYSVSPTVKNLTKLIDAIIDITIVSFGTLNVLGIDEKTFNTMFRAVIDANMKKVKSDGSNELSVSKPGRGGKNDFIKPVGWQSPDDEIEKILSKYYSGD